MQQKTKLDKELCERIMYREYKIQVIERSAREQIHPLEQEGKELFARLCDESKISHETHDIDLEAGIAVEKSAGNLKTKNK